MKNKENKNVSRRHFTKLVAAGAIGGAISASSPGYLLAQQNTKLSKAKIMKNSKKLRVSYVGFFHETNTYLTEGMGETSLD
jgi:hypothetical protein